MAEVEARKAIETIKIYTHCYTARLAGCVVACACWPTWPCESEKDAILTLKQPNGVPGLASSTALRSVVAADKRWNIFVFTFFSLLRVPLVKSSKSTF